MSLSLFIVKTDYLNFLRSDIHLEHVYDNKEDTAIHSRKYLGIVLNINPFKYYVPLSSPKPSDYDSYGNIRKDVIPFIRIISKDINGDPELKGTIKIGSMIPVPDQSIIPYIIADEADSNYKILVEKEYEFIKKNQDRIINNALILYKQKTKDPTFYIDKFKPNYINFTIDFLYAEKKCLEYIQK